MTKPLRIVLSAIILTVAGLVACLQTGPRTVTSEESKIEIGHVPGLEGRPVVYLYYGWRPSYQAVEQYYAAGPPTTEEYSAEVPSGGSSYPRLEVHFYVVAPGWTWTRGDLQMNEDYVKGYSFFGDKTISIADRRPIEASGVEVVPFEVGGAHCFAFLARDVALPHLPDQKTLPVSVDGYYCAAPDVTIDAAMTTNVLSNIMVTDSLLHPRTPIIPTARAQAPGN